jgi:hypothetical protein
MRQSWPDEDLTDQLMILSYHPFEYCCCRCGHIAGTSAFPQLGGALVLYRVTWGRCRRCRYNNYLPEGWWLVLQNVIPETPRMVVPYTLLCHLDDES